MPSTLTDDYKSAVALNNMGVLLLEGGAFRQAIETLQDAVIVMKLFLQTNKIIEEALYQTSPSSCSGGSSTKKRIVQAKLRNAMQRTNRALRSPRKQSPNIHVDAVSQEEFLSSSESFPILHSEDMLSNTLSTTIMFPIKIDPIHPSAELDSRDHDLESATIIYNFAVAHLCLSSVSSSFSSRYSKLQKDALKLFKMAHQVIAVSRHVGREDDGEEKVLVCDDVIKSDARLQLAAVVLKCVGQILTEQGRVPEAQAATETLIRIGTLIDRRIMLQNEMGCAAAAA